MYPTIMTLSAVVLTVLGLGFYTVHKMTTPGSFRVQTSIWRVFSFRVEIESRDWTERPIPPKE